VVLFADIVGFTTMSSIIDPCAIVSVQNNLFSMFNNVIEKYGLKNKVKTFENCYIMMVTSVPATLKMMKWSTAEECHFGLDMIATLHKYKSEG
jgi:class 3 adenylate cyclase